MKGNRGCLERGWVNIQDVSHCGNNKCESCNMIAQAIKNSVGMFKIRYVDREGNPVEPPTEYDNWGLITELSPQMKENLKEFNESIKETANRIVYEQIKKEYMQPYNKQSIVDRIKEAQEEYNKLLDDLNKETPSD